jgi:hypothetical protein
MRDPNAVRPFAVADRTSGVQRNLAESVFKSPSIGSGRSLSLEIEAPNGS